MLGDNFVPRPPDAWQVYPQNAKTFKKKRLPHQMNGAMGARITKGLPCNIRINKCCDKKDSKTIKRAETFEVNKPTKKHGARINKGPPRERRQGGGSIY